MEEGLLAQCREFVARFFPECALAVLGGSVGRSEGLVGSDLDLVILDDSFETPFRHTYRENDWIVEAFVLTTPTYREMFDEGIAKANPSLQRILAEGIVLVEDSFGQELVTEAREDLAYGPMPWSQEEREAARYRIAEVAEDVRGGRNRTELMFSVGSLSTLLCEFLLRVNRQWVGEGKHLYRCYAAFDASGAERLAAALDDFCREDRAAPFLELTERLLATYGGLQLEGYHQDRG